MTNKENLNLNYTAGEIGKMGQPLTIHPEESSSRILEWEKLDSANKEDLKQIAFTAEGAERLIQIYEHNKNFLENISEIDEGGKSLESVTEHLASIKVSRRKTLLWRGIAVLGAVSMIGGISDGIKSFNYYEGVRTSYDEAHKLPEEVKTEANWYKALQTEANRLADKGKLDAARQLIQSEEYLKTNSAFVKKNEHETTNKKGHTYVEREAEKVEPTLLKNNPMARLAAAFGGMCGVFLGFGLSTFYSGEIKRIRSKIDKNRNR